MPGAPASLLQGTVWLCHRLLRRKDPSIPSHPAVTPQDVSIRDVPLAAAAHAISPRAQPTPTPRPCVADPASRVAKMKL